MRPLEDFRTHRKTSGYLVCKGELDRVMAFFMLIILLPLIVILLFLVRATSPGPALYRQSRVGRNGAVFQLYKIRSMRIDAESSGSGPVWSQACDPRVTKLGRWIRDLHLDELPQLWNVLRGEMSLVGPRPERPEFVSILKQKIPDYEKRLEVLPGITGLAQMNLPPDSDLNSVRKKLHLDLAYIREVSLMLDIRLMVCTFVCLIGWRKEAVVRRLMLDRSDEILRFQMSGVAEEAPRERTTVPIGEVFPESEHPMFDSPLQSAGTR
jgi:lipopolysaccharide/colanic/teichoic acid biosynthesis glycosyltransferase